MNVVVLDYQGRDVVLLAPVPDECQERLRYDEPELRRRLVQVPDYPPLGSLALAPEAYVGDTAPSRPLSFLLSPLATPGSARLAGWVATAADEFTGSRVRDLVHDENRARLLGANLGGGVASVVALAEERRARDAERGRAAQRAALGLPERPRG